MDIKSLLGSKSVVMVVAIVGVIVMNVAGRIDGQPTLDFIKWVLTAWFGAEAAAQAAEAFAKGKVAAAEKVAAASIIVSESPTAQGLADLKKVGEVVPVKP